MKTRYSLLAGWGLLLGSVFGFASCGLAQSTVYPGQWKAYLSFRHSGPVTARGDMYYKLADVGLASWNSTTHEYREYSRVDGLSGAEPTALYYAQGADEIFIGYGDGTIDYFRQPDALRQIFDIKLATTFAARGIRHFTAQGDTLYIATDFGLVAYDLARNETRFSVSRIGSASAEAPVNRVAVGQGKLWVLLQAGLYSAPLQGANLADPAAWRQEFGLRGLPATGVIFLAASLSKVYVGTVDSVYATTGSAWQPVLSLPPGKVVSVEAGTKSVNLIIGGYLAQYYDDQPPFIFSSLTPITSYLQADKDRLVAASNDLGLAVWDLHVTNGPQRIFDHQSTLPTNKASQLAAADGILFIAPVGYVDHFVEPFDQSGVYIVNTATNETHVLSRANEGLDSTVFFDLGVVCYDRQNHQATFGSWGQGAIVTDATHRLATLNENNSRLQGIAFNPATGHYEPIIVSGIALDPNGTKWFSCFDADSSLVALTATGAYYPLSIGTEKRPLRMAVDQNNYKWIVLAEQGILVYDDRRKPEQSSLHRYKILDQNIGNGALPGLQVLSVAVDLDGAVWVGTGSGVTVFYSPEKIFNNTGFKDAICPVYAQHCLLADARIQALAVDGANRKWIGTDQGAFLVSADGSQVLQQFTTENSPLFSNSITDISIDPGTGEVFFATPLGVISYRGTATEAAAANTHILIFPNPVYSDYAGPVTVRGLVEGSIVKVTTIDGSLVNELKATGGQVVWDGHDSLGQHLASGVYLVLVATGDGQNTAAEKVVFINR